MLSIWFIYFDFKSQILSTFWIICMWLYLKMIIQLNVGLHFRSLTVIFDSHCPVQSGLPLITSLFKQKHVFVQLVHLWKNIIYQIQTLLLQHMDIKRPHVTAFV